MGIKNFFKIINKNSRSDYGNESIGEMGERVELEDMKGERLAIDVSNMIYQAILAMQFVNTLTDTQGRPTAHILTIFNKVLQMKKFGIDQVWVFDSPHVNPLKTEELQKRRKRREKSKNDKVQFQMTSEHVEDIKELLQHMGVSYIIAPEGIEAEQYGAVLTAGSIEERYCQYMISGDSDVLLFGGNLLRPISKRQSEDGKPHYMAYDVNMIMEEMDLDRDKLVKMGLAMGSDFAEKTPRLGAKTVHAKARYDKIPLTIEQEVAYNYFMSEVELGEADMVENQYNREELLLFLERRGFTRERYEKRLDKVFGAADN